VAVKTVVEMVGEMIVTRHLSRVIHLTGFAKNDGETDNFCSVCVGGRNFFSLIESMVEKLIVDEWFFSCCFSSYLNFEFFDINNNIIFINELLIPLTV
jgi:hypothetical protein